jgi:hypothetical protein
MKMEKRFHFMGKAMSHFFLLKEENLSSSSATFPPESAPKGGYTSWKAHSTPHPKVWKAPC